MSIDEKKFIYRVLSASNVDPSSVLTVHAAFKNFSIRGFQAEAVIDGLLSYMHKGTLLMPTMTWRTVTPLNPIFDVLSTPSHTGILSEIFRTKYSKFRSLHPTHSVAGYGVDAKYLLSSHHIGNTPVPFHSPYGLMRDFDANILFLGVGFEMCTAIHHMEELIDPNRYLMPEDSTEDYDLIDVNKNIYKYSLRRHRKLSRDFTKYSNILLKTSEMFRLNSDLKCSVVNLKVLNKLLISELLIKNKNTLIEVDGD